MKKIKLTPRLLNRIIKEEKEKMFGDGRTVEDEGKKAEEVDADELADTLEKHIDYVKALKIEESRLRRRLLKLREAKLRAVKKIINKV